MSCLPWSEGLESAYTFPSRFGAEVKMGVRDEGRLWVPRETAPIGKHDLRRRYPPAAISCSKPPLDEHQAQFIERSVVLLKAGHNHVCEASTGFGKSYCGAAIAARMGQPTLILVTKEDLIYGSPGNPQWMETLTDLIGVPRDQVGVVQQKRCEYEGRRFVLGMVQSIVKAGKYPPEFFKHFGMVIFDEVHHMAADTFVLACQKFYAYYRLGLSATVSRADGKAPLFHAHLGPTLVRGEVVPMKPKVLVKRTGWRVPPSWVMGKDGKWEMKVAIPAGDRMMKVYAKMAASPRRNALIVNFVRQAYHQGRTTLVISDLIEKHLDVLFGLLAASGVPGECIGYYISGKGQHEAERERCRTPGKVKVVLATYGMVAEGTNVPHWDCGVMATPRAGAKQPIGRLLRKRPGKPQPVWLDLVDADEVFFGYYQARERDYYSIGATIVHLKPVA